MIEILKEKFGNRIQVDLLIKDNDGNTRTHHSDINSLNSYLKQNYTLEALKEIVGI